MVRVESAGPEARDRRHFVVEGSGPFAVAQSTIGPGCEPSGLGSGEPAMALEVSIDQGHTSHPFTVPSTYGRDLVNVAMPEAGGLDLRRITPG